MAIYQSSPAVPVITPPAESEYKSVVGIPWTPIFFTDVRVVRDVAAATTSLNTSPLICWMYPALLVYPDIPGVTKSCSPLL